MKRLRVAVALAAWTMAVSCGAALVGAQTADASSASVDKLCNKAFPRQISKTFDIRFGTKTLYNRDASRSLVCSGAFGAPDAFRPTFASACSLAMAAYKVINPVETVFKTWGCAAPAIGDKGWVQGSLAAGVGVACGYLAQVLGVGVGVFAAGATLNPAIGVAVWKGTAFVGDTIVCIGIDNVRDDARSWGIKLEADHELRVARDIETRGKCLQRRNRTGLGIQYNAVDCPARFRGSSLPDPPDQRPAGDRRYRGTTSQGASLTARTTSDGRGLQLRGSHIFDCTGWNPYGIWRLDFVFQRQRPFIRADGTFDYRRTWTNLTSTALFPWPYDDAQTVIGSFSADGRTVSGQITEAIIDHRPAQFANPPTGPVDPLEAPAPGYGDQTRCTSNATFTAKRIPA